MPGDRSRLVLAILARPEARRIARHRGGPFSTLAITLPAIVGKYVARHDQRQKLASLDDRLLRDMGRAIGDHRLIESGDRIMVAMSGGKDSYAMCVLLRDLQARAPVRFDLLAVHLDQGQPGYDGAPLAGWLEAEGIPHKLLHENTYAIVTEKIPEGKTYCSLCSRLRHIVQSITRSSFRAFSN